MAGLSIGPPVCGGVILLLAHGLPPSDRPAEVLHPVQRKFLLNAYEKIDRITFLILKVLFRELVT